MRALGEVASTADLAARALVQARALLDAALTGEDMDARWTGMVMEGTSGAYWREAPSAYGSTRATATSATTGKSAQSGAWIRSGPTSGLPG